MVRSYSKSHGPDLRVAVIGGPSAVVERARVRRTHGSGWTSRLLQMALAWMLTDSASVRAVTIARAAYASRLQTLAHALRERGIQIANRHGLSLWIPVADERAALVTLAARGIAVTPGDRFWTGRGRPHVRAATSRVTKSDVNLPEALALAAEHRGRTAEDENAVERPSTPIPVDPRPPKRSSTHSPDIVGEFPAQDR